MGAGRRAATAKSDAHAEMMVPELHCNGVNVVESSLTDFTALHTHSLEIRISAVNDAMP
jgi:hypothetical protein